jgi:hypothetical protein
MRNVKTPSMLVAFEVSDAGLVRIEYPQLENEVNVSKDSILPNMAGCFDPTNQVHVDYYESVVRDSK